MKKNVKEQKTKMMINQLNEVISHALNYKEDYIAWLRFILKNNHYSINNTALLYAHCKEPLVHTKKQWQELSINVKDDAQKIYLLRPRPYEGFYRKNKEWVDLAKATTAEKQQIKDGTIKVLKGMNYGSFCVYDIQDTDADMNTIMAMRQEQGAMRYDLQKALQQQDTDLPGLIELIKKKIETTLPQAYDELYAAGTLFLCGERLGFDPMISNFHLLSKIDNKQLPKLKKVMSQMVKDSETIVRSLTGC